MRRNRDGSLEAHKVFGALHIQFWRARTATESRSLSTATFDRHDKFWHPSITEWTSPLWVGPHYGLVSYRL